MVTVVGDPSTVESLFASVTTSGAVTLFGTDTYTLLSYWPEPTRGVPAPQLKASGGPLTVYSAESGSWPLAVATMYALPARPAMTHRPVLLADWPGWLG